MAINKELKLRIADLPQDELAKVVLKWATKDKVLLDYILFTYFREDKPEEEIYNEYLQKINDLALKRYKGFVEEQKAIHYITACNKEIANFEKIVKNNEYSINLILQVIDNSYDSLFARFGTSFEGYEYKISLLLKKIIKILTTKMHEDYMLEYREKVNIHLTRIQKSYYLDCVADLPKEI